MSARKRTAAEVAATRRQRLMDMAMNEPLGFLRHDACRRLAMDGNATADVLAEAIAAGVLCSIRWGRKIVYTHPSRASEVAAALDDHDDMHRRRGSRIQQTVIPVAEALGKIPRLRVPWVFAWRGRIKVSNK